MVLLPNPESTPPDVIHLPTLAERVRMFLEVRGMLSGQIRATEDEGSIILEGMVDRFYDRQVALSCAQHVSGVRHVVDRISVREPRNASVRREI